MPLLFKFRLSETKLVETLVIQGSKLSKNDDELLKDVTECRQIVGCFQYLTLTRLDIAYVVNQVSQFLQSPQTTHLQAQKQILHFVKGTLDKGLVFTKYTSQFPALVAYSDSDQAEDLDDCRSTTGACLFLGGNIVMWVSETTHNLSLKR